jgi:hypothetical protein
VCKRKKSESSAHSCYEKDVDRHQRRSKKSRTTGLMTKDKDIFYQELFLIDNVPALDLFWIAAQGRNDVCCREWVLAFHDKSNDGIRSVASAAKRLS